MRSSIIVLALSLFSGALALAGEQNKCPYVIKTRYYEGLGQKMRNQELVELSSGRSVEGRIYVDATDELREMYYVEGEDRTYIRPNDFSVFLPSKVELPAGEGQQNFKALQERWLSAIACNKNNTAQSAASGAAVKTK